MSLRVQKLAPNVLGVDTIAKLHPTTCRQLLDRGYRFRGAYVDELDAAEMAAHASANLPLLPYTYANEFDPSHTLERLTALGIPPGPNVVLDVEDVITPTALAAMTAGDVEDFTKQLIAKIDAWGRGLSNHAYLPAIYLGGFDLLTSDELTKLAVYRYHAGAARLRDRFNHPSEPARGYALFQGRPCNVDLLGDGTLFDVDYHRQDYADDVFSVVVNA